jgi:muramoyltetrapeptide carboxypeptidase
MADQLTIQLIAPSGFPDGQAQRRGVERLRKGGHRVLGEECGSRRHLRFAGTDAERIAEINALAAPGRPLPDIVMAVRGGYGVHRLLAHLDYEGLRERVRNRHCVLVGHSDFTALSLALLARADMISFAGPMLAYDFGGQTTSGFTLRHFWETVGSTSHVARWQHRAPQEPVNVHGMLWGGNLAVLCSLLGTPYMPDVDNGILFLEDVFEPAYRIERLLYQLKLSGVLDRQRAVLLGDFSSCRPDEYDPAYNMHAMVAQIRRVTDVPILGGLPFGHCRDKLTLPIGARARLRVGADGDTELAFAGYPHVTSAEARAMQDPRAGAGSPGSVPM